MRLIQLIAPLFAVFLSTAYAGNQALVADRCEGLGIYVASVVADYSSACGNSYPGQGQPLYNIEQTPATSEAQSYYDFFLGSNSSPTSSDPTFVGQPGKRGSYFSFDGSDLLCHNTTSATSFFADQHRSDTSNTWTLWFAFKFIQTDITANLMGNSNSNTVPGWQLQSQNSENVIWRRNGDTSGTTATTLHGASTLANGVNYIVFLTYENATRAWTSRLYSSGTSVLSSSGTAASLTATSAATGRMCAGGNNGSTTAIPNGSFVYETGFANAVLSGADMDTITAKIEARTGIDFTP